MATAIKLLSTDFDGTMVSRVSEPVLHASGMEFIRQRQSEGAIWAINTGRSVDLLESGLTDFAFPFRPDFILTSERDIFRPTPNGKKGEAFGDWNERCARAHAELYTSASSVLEQVIDFVNQKTKAHIIYEAEGPTGLIAASEEEMERVTQFIEQARSQQPKFHYQRNTVYLRFCIPIITKARPSPNCLASSRSTARTSSRRATIIMTYPCSMGRSQPCRPARPTQFRK